MGQRYKEFSFALLIAGTFFHPAFPASSEQKKGTMKPHGLYSPQCVKIYAAKIAVFFLSTYIPLRILPAVNVEAYEKEMPSVSRPAFFPPVEAPANSIKEEPKPNRHAQTNPVSRNVR